MNEIYETQMKTLRALLGFSEASSEISADDQDRAEAEEEALRDEEGIDEEKADLGGIEQDKLNEK